MKLNHSSTFILKSIIVLIGLAVLGLCVFILPSGITTDRTGWYRPILIGMYVPAVPFFIALFHGLKLLNLIDLSRAFSRHAVHSLRVIKYCAGAISLMYGLGLPYIFMVADRDDAPGVVLIALIFTFAPLVVAVIAANLQKLLFNAIKLKKERALTV